MSALASCSASDSPNFGHRHLILKGRIAEMFHPVEVILHGVVDAISAAEPHADSRNPGMSDKRGMV